MQQEKDIISIYRPEALFPVYEQNFWKSDRFDAMKYGRNFDFGRSFFEQYEELRQCVPHLAMVNSNSVNSEYTKPVSRQQRLLYACHKWRE